MLRWNFGLSDGKTMVQAFTGAISNDKWRHVAGVRGGKKIRLYLDGKLKSEVDDTLGNLSNKYALFLGKAGAGNNIGGPSGMRAFNGELDEPRIYKRALTAEEIGKLASIE